MINLKYSKTLKKYISVVVQYYPWLEVLLFFVFGYSKMRPCQGGSHVARLNFKTSRVGVYIKCLSLIVGFAVIVATWPREVVSCRDFILRAVATFWAMSLVGIYPGRASKMMSLEQRKNSLEMSAVSSP